MRFYFSAKLRYYPPQIPEWAFGVDSIDVASLLQSIIGDELYKLKKNDLGGAREVKWRNENALKLSRSNDTTLFADIQLAADIPTFSDPKIDAEVYLAVGCETGKISFKAKGTVDVALPLILKLIDFLVFWKSIEVDSIAQKFENRLSQLTKTISTGQPDCNEFEPICIAEDGSIHFGSQRYCGNNAITYSTSLHNRLGVISEPQLTFGYDLLGDSIVAKELSLSNDQQMKLNQIQNDFLVAYGRLETLLEKERDTEIQRVRESTRKQIDLVLTNLQRHRLYQIELQIEGAKAFRRPEIRTALNLSDENSPLLQVFFQEEWQRIFGVIDHYSDPRQRATVIREIWQIRQQITEKTMAQLDTQRKAHWQQLVGAAADIETILVSSATNGENREDSFPSTFTLSQNYPNPFNPSTQIEYRLPSSQHVTLKVYNLLGQEVATLVDENKVAGLHFAVFDGKNLPTGVYVYRMQAEGFSQSRKFMLLK